MDEALRTQLRLRKQAAIRRPAAVGLAGRPGRHEDRQLILVDSSVWIDYFNGTVTRQTEISIGCSANSLWQLAT